MAYVNGGHEPLIHFNKFGIAKRLKATGPVVGMMTEMQYKVEHIQLAPDDFLIGYTDGVTEALSPDKQLFSKKRFFSLLEKPAASASEQIEKIKADIYAHIGDAPQFDDITMIVLHRKPKY